MTTTYDPVIVDAAVQGFPVTLSKPDRVASVHLMTAHGLSAEEVSYRLGMSERQVVRDRVDTVPAPEPPLEPSYEWCNNPDELADTALQLTRQVRSQNPLELLGNITDFCAWYPAMAAQLIATLAAWHEPRDSEELLTRRAIQALENR